MSKGTTHCFVCKLEFRTDLIIRHLFAHRNAIKDVMPPSCIQYVQNLMKPVMLVRRNDQYTCVCLHCKQGKRETTIKSCKDWIEGHNSISCADAWPTYESLFVLPEDYVPDVPPTPRNFVSLNPVSESTDDGEGDTEIRHSRGPGFNATDEGLMREYHSLYRKYQLILVQRVRLENNMHKYCGSAQSFFPNKRCECWLHGNHTEWNALDADVKKAEDELADFKQTYTHLVQEYYNRVLQPGGYEW